MNKSKPYEVMFFTHEADGISYGRRSYRWRWVARLNVWFFHRLGCLIGATSSTIFTEPRR